MPLLHIEHPEDAILTGDLDPLDWAATPGRLSLKIDGSPAIIWGTDPTDGKFFVGTKSVFNKKTPKLIKSIKDLSTHGYEGELFDILFHCFRFLPRTEAIYQGDFMGYGGEKELTPNVLTYEFDQTIMANIVVAPHTVHVGNWDDGIRDTAPVPLKHGQLESTMYCHFVQPKAWAHDYDYDYWDNDEGQERFYIQEKVNFAKQMATLVKFATKREAAKIKKALNACIREQREVIPEEFTDLCDINLIRFWLLVNDIKHQMLASCCHEATIRTLYEWDYVAPEGFVFDNGFGTYKLVDRHCFSFVNFHAHG